MERAMIEDSRHAAVAVIERLPPGSVRPWTATVLGVATVALVGVVDWISGPDLSLVIFYIVPVLGVTWLGGERPGLAVAVTATAESMVIGLFGPQGPSTAVTIWNSGARLAFYLLVVWLTSGMRHLVEEERATAALDPLTGALNRRAFYAESARQFERCRRRAEPLALLYLDVDGLKALNDNAGHEQGDLLLTRFVLALRSTLRTDDQLARLGGDEFAVLLPGASLDDSTQVAERMLERLASDPGGPMMASFGLACYQQPPSDIEAALRVADDLMYRAKMAGGGRIVSELQSVAA